MKNISRTRAICSLLLLLLCSFSLLFGDDLSKPVTEVIEELYVKVTMRDGVRLSTNIYRPDTQGTFPTLRMRTILHM